MLLLAATVARADYAVLRNGQRLHVTGYQLRGASVELQVEGGRVLLPAEEVTGFEPEELFQPVERLANPAPFGGLIRAAAEKHGVNERLISSVIAAESNFEPRAVSPKRAQGLMQLMPSTAARYAVANAFDPAQNIDAGTRYLKELLDQYHQDLTLALAAYNAGPGRVNRYSGVPPFPETHAYLRRVTHALGESSKKQSWRTDPGARSIICSPFLAACKDATANARQ